MVKQKSILIISASGMGCTIMFTPTLRAIREMFPNSHITFLATSKSFAAPVIDSNLIDETFLFDFPKNSLFHLSSLWSRIRLLLKLRERKFDYSFTVFPSNKWHFNLFAWLVGANKRVTHKYETSQLTNLAFLQNIKIPADENLHDVDQNLNLISSVTSQPDFSEKDLFFQISAKDIKAASEYLKTNLIPGKKIVGIHAGSSQDFSFSAKRWPLKNFAKLSDMIQENLGVEVCYFFGPNEEEDIAQLNELMMKKAHVVQLPIKTVAAIIKQCDVMVSSDSGLMHIAVAMKTPVVAIFGPTSLSRTYPYTKKAEVLYDKNCNSLSKYPFQTTTAKLDQEKAKECFKKITIEKVFSAVQKYL